MKVLERNKFYSHCNKKGNQRAMYWKFHPEKSQKEEKKYVKALVKKLDNEVVQQESKLKEVDPLTRLGERW